MTRLSVWAPRPMILAFGWLVLLTRHGVHGRPPMLPWWWRSRLHVLSDEEAVVAATSRQRLLRRVTSMIEPAELYGGGAVVARRGHILVSLRTGRAGQASRLT